MRPKEKPPAISQVARGLGTVRAAARNVTGLDAEIQREVFVYDGAVRLGSIFALASAKWAAVDRKGALLGYFHHERAAFRRLTEGGRKP